MVPEGFGESRSATTLFSLLGLLHPAEYFVTIDHSVLWQRHIAWSKPEGDELRHYVTQRYASNMIFLSCLLAAEINVFFNSSVELTDMRHLLQQQSAGSDSSGSNTMEHDDATATTMSMTIPPHYQLRYWIGIIMLIDASVTLIALVTTFTLWGMVSSISDANTHALLRSSIGQYVTSLPSRFTVGALYLFLLWMMGFIINLVHGTVVCACLVCLVLGLFFQAVIPLSAFGRLIIHTGAMAKRPVLDEALEQELLPSGLHASLLIRATDRRRKYACATDQYRKQNWKHFYQGSSTTAGSSSKMNHTTTTTTTSGGGRGGGGGEGGSGRGSFQHDSHNHNSNPLPPSSSYSSYYHPHQEKTTARHVKRPSSNSAQLVPPRTITATIRTEGEDDDHGLEEGMRGQRQRHDSDEITIDFEVGGDGEEQEPLLSSSSLSQQERPERHAHFPTNTTTTSTPVAESHASSLVWNPNSPENEDNENDTEAEDQNDGGSGGGLTTVSSTSPSLTRNHHHHHHRRMETCDTIGSEFFFPRASVLNAALSSRELDDVVQTALRSSSMMTNSHTRAEGSNYNNNNYDYNHHHYNPTGNYNSYLPQASSGGGGDNGADAEDKNAIPDAITPTAAQSTMSDVSPLATDGFPTPATTKIKDSEANPSAATTPTTEEPPPPPPPPAPESSASSSSNNNHNIVNKEQHLNTIGTEGLLGVREESPRQVPPLGWQGSWKKKSSLSPKPKHSPKQQQQHRQQQQQGVEIPKKKDVDATGKPQQRQQQHQQQHQQWPQKTTIDSRHPLLSNRPLQQHLQQQQSRYAPRSTGPGWSSQPASPTNSTDPNQNHSPTPHHRRRLSAGRRSTSSLFAFLGGGVDKEEREWEEENEVRAMFDAIPSADLDSHDQIMEELEYSQDNNMVLTSMPHPLKKHTSSTGSLPSYGRQKQQQQQQQQQQMQVYSPFVATLNDINQTHDSHSLGHFDDSTSSFVYITPTTGETNSGFGHGQSNQPYQYPKSALRSRTSSMTGSGKRRHRRLHSLPPIMAFEPGTEGPEPQQPLWSSPIVPSDNNRRVPKTNDSRGGTIVTNEPPRSSNKGSNLSGSSPLQVQKSQLTRFGNGRGGTNIAPSPSSMSFQNSDSRVPRYSHRRSSYSDKDAYEDPDVSRGGHGGGTSSTSRREALTITTTNANQNPAIHPSHRPNPVVINKTATAPGAAGSAAREEEEEDTAKEGTHLLSGKGGSSSSNLRRYSSSS